MSTSAGSQLVFAKAKARRPATLSPESAHDRIRIAMGLHPLQAISPNTPTPTAAGSFINAHQQGSAGTRSATPPTSDSKRNKRAPVKSVRDMVEDSFQCCKTLKCVEEFYRGIRRKDILRVEQADFAKLSTCKARHEWVSGQVPRVKGRKNGGSMLAANTLVCNRFFREAFGVSFTLIENSKKNPRSTAVTNR